MEITAAEPYIEQRQHFFAEHFTEQVIKTDSGAEIACYLRRQGNKHTLVLIPGTFFPHYIWADMIQALDVSVDILVMDWPGIGKSSPKMPHTTLEDLTAIMLDAIGKDGVQIFILGGHSLGGMAAVEALRQADERMIGAIALEGWTHHTVQQNAFNRRGTPWSMLTEQEQANSDAMRAWALRGWTQEEQNAFATVWRGWNGGYRALAETNLPVLEIWGDRGLKPRPSPDDLQIPGRSNIKLTWISDACHYYLISKPVEIAAAVSGFLDKIMK